MTLEEKKKLLLKELCGRLPYGVNIKDDFGDIIHVNINNAHIEHLITRISYGIDKMFLRPLSSMTEEEMERLTDTHSLLSADGIPYNVCCTVEGMDYLNSINVDYRGLIPMGLALEAPEDMYKIE